MIEDKVLRTWWMKWVVRPNPDIADDRTQISISVSELNKLVASVRGTERLRIVRLRRPI